MTLPAGPADDDYERLVLGDLLSHVLNKGVVLTGEITISVAGIDLIKVGLAVMIAAVETLEQRHASVRSRLVRPHADLPVLPAGERR